ncbi:hypothetical protein GDO81_006698 [Engystomops pustulosus]|uniref:Uncharacterized protein n=1 Tax=Engystomops pustulosus TaxID=76066 RepID=A0AAV7CYT0_ENGPU|nr:hypothetical protein GDO81_006698 [Engystomops pustulosus]
MGVVLSTRADRCPGATNAASSHGYFGSRFVYLHCTMPELRGLLCFVIFFIQFFFLLFYFFLHKKFIIKFVFKNISLLRILLAAYLVIVKRY